MNFDIDMPAENGSTGCQYFIRCSDNSRRRFELYGLWDKPWYHRKRPVNINFHNYGQIFHRIKLPPRDLSLNIPCAVREMGLLQRPVRCTFQTLHERLKKGQTVLNGLDLYIQTSIKEVHVLMPEVVSPTNKPAVHIKINMPVSFHHQGIKYIHPHMVLFMHGYQKDDPSFIGVPIKTSVFKGELSHVEEESA